MPDAISEYIAANAAFETAKAAAEAVVGLAIVLLVYRNWQGINTDNVSVMKW